MSVKANITLILEAIKTLVTTGTFVSSKDNTVTHKLAITLKGLGGSSTPPVSEAISGEITMIGGAATLDLRAIADASTGATIDGNGKKVQFLAFVSKEDNANPIVITPGAANGYNIFGDADAQETLAAAEDAVIKVNNDSLPDIDATHKTIDFAGTGAQKIQYLLILG